MKLRLQLAGMLPALANLGPTDLLSKAAFGTTMQAMMARLPSEKVSVPGDTRVSADMQSLIPKRTGTGEARKTSQGSPAESAETFALQKTPQIGTSFPVVTPDELMGKGETPEDRDGQCTNGTPPMHEMPDAHPLKGATSERLFVQRSIVSRNSHLIPEPGDAPQQSAGTLLQLSESKNASSRMRPKTDAGENKGSHPAMDTLSSNVPLVPQSAPIVVPVLVLQPGELTPALSTGSSQADSSHIDLSHASPRPSTQPMVVGSHDSQDGPGAIPESTMVKERQVALVTISDRPHEGTPPDANTGHSTNGQPDRVIVERADARAVTPESQNHHLQGASAEFVDSIHIDTRVQKTSQIKIEAEQKFQVPANFPSHIAPVPASQHQAVINLPQVTFHDAQKEVLAHRPQAGAAQVLQRMDMAIPTGAVQLRAEARRLDVGLSSGVLGWVEVRATAAASGRVDATLQVQNDSSAHMLASQSRDIADYAREHSVVLGELSVGVGTGDGAGGDAPSAHSDERNGGATRGREPRPKANEEHTYRPAERLSFISVRA